MTTTDALCLPASLALPALLGVAEPSTDPRPRLDEEPWLDSDSVFSVYRGETIKLLRKYFRLSIEIGRLPSLVGREFFRSRISSTRMHTFEDVVIFAHDVERCLALLDDFSQQMIARVILQEYEQYEAAKLLGC